MRISKLKFVRSPAPFVDCGTTAGVESPAKSTSIPVQRHAVRYHPNAGNHNPLLFGRKISARMPAPIKIGAVMAQRCQICGKGPHYGNVISHANNKRRRRWNPNLRRVRALVNGARKQMRVCTACLRSGRVKKAA
jgi:large subunit ribosomal protein L28